METEDKTCVITVHNVPGWELDADMLREVLNRCTRHVPNCKVIDIYPQERRAMTRISDAGMLEWIMRLHFHTGGAMTIGAIQRQPGARVEFHS
jgi:hypothetical protein